MINGEPGVPQLQKRLLSVLAAPKLTRTDNAASLKLREGSLVGRRYESSAAAVDSSDTPPVEKHEYQAEVTTGAMANVLFFLINLVLPTVS